MKKITLVLLMLMSTAAWADQYQGQMDKVRFASKMNDAKTFCEGMLKATDMAFNTMNERFYKEHLVKANSLTKEFKGLYCPEMTLKIEMALNK